MNERSLSEWLVDPSSLSPGRPLSIHLDEITGVGPVPGVVTRSQLLHTAIGVLRQIESSISHLFEKRSITLACYVPIGTSDELMTWDESWLSEISDSSESPAFYLIEGVSIFELHDEEYKRPLSLNFEAASGLKSVYRSFRSRQFLERGWEFSNGIYLWQHFDFSG